MLLGFCKDPILSYTYQLKSLMHAIIYSFDCKLNMILNTLKILQ